MGKFPSNIDAERAAIYSMIIDNKTISEVFTVINAEDFSHNQHKIIVEVIKELNDNNHPVDLVTINNYLLSHPKLSKAVKHEYITDILDTIASPHNISTYIDVIKEKSNLRKIIITMNQMREEAEAEPDNVDEFMDKVQQTIFELSVKKSKNSIVSIKDGLKEFHDKLKEMQNLKSGLTGITTGFKKLDQYTGGLQRSDLIIIAARPAMGKTSFALNLATNAAKAGYKVAIFSLEMPVIQLINRIMAAEASINSSNLKQGKLKGNEWSKLGTQMANMVKTKMFLDDTGGISIAELSSKARMLKMTEGLDLILIDYLQLMTGAGENSRELEISNISRALKSLAKELDLPIVALSQLNRKLETRTNKRPILSDLRESGAIEQDADQIMFIYRGEDYQDKDMEEGVAEIIIGKNRHGSIGSFLTIFQGEFTRFDNRIEDSYEDMPI